MQSLIRAKLGSLRVELPIHASLASFKLLEQLPADDLEGCRGLFWRRPVIAAAFTAALLSLTGMPATMGFLDKFYVLATGARAAAWLLILILVIATVIGLFCYLKVTTTFTTVGKVVLLDCFA